MGERGRHIGVAWIVTQVTPHPHGGYAPSCSDQKGHETAACLFCEFLLMREASRDAIAHSAADCPECRRRSVGGSVAHLETLADLA